MATIASLVVNMEMSLAKFNQGLDQAQAMTDRAMKKISSAADLAKASLVGLGGVLSVGGMVTLVRNAIDATAQLHDLSQQTGVSVERLSALAFVARQADTDLGEVAAALQRLSKRMYEVYSGSESAGAAFAALGLKVADASGKLKTPDQMLVEIAKKLATFNKGAGTTALMMEIFGRAGANLGKFLSDLAQQQELVAIRSTEQAERAEAFNQTIKRLSESARIFAQSLVLDLLPALEKSIPLIKTAAVLVALWFAGFVAGPTIIAAVVAALAGLSSLVTTSVAYFAAANTAIEAMNTSLFGTSIAATAASGALGVLKIAGGVLFAAFAGWQIGKTLSENFLEARLAGIAMVQGLLKVWEWLKFGFNAAIEGMKNAWGVFLELLGKGLSTIPGMGNAGGILQKLGQSQKGATMASLAAQRDANIASNAAIFSTMADDAIAEFERAKKTTEVGLKAPPMMPSIEKIAKGADLLKARLEGELKLSDQAIASEKKLLGEREAMLDRYYRDDKLSIADYFEGRGIAMQSAAEATQNYYAKEIAAVEGWQSHYRRGTAQYEEAAKRIREIQGKAALAQEENTARMGQATYDQGKAYDELGSKVQALDADYQAMLGNLDTAAAIRFDLSNAALRKRLGIEGMTEALRQLDALRARVIENTATDWESGVSRSLRNYVDGVRNAAAATEQAFTRGLNMMEDALVEMVRTGKINLKSLADYAISEFVRLSVVRPVVSDVADAVRSSGGLGGLVKSAGSFLGSLFGGFKAAGGPLEPHKWYIAGEHGPEPVWGGGAGAFAAGYGAQPAAPSVSVVQNINIDARSDQATIAALMIRAKDQAKAEILASMRRGGAFA